MFRGPEFTDTRSPDPSPLSSPVKGAGRFEDDDAPPIVIPGDLFEFDCLGSPNRPSTPTADRRQDAKAKAAPAKNPPSNVPRHKDKHNPKHLSAHRPGVVPPHRRSQQLKDKRDVVRRRLLRVNSHERRVARARDGISRLQRKANALMKPEHMNDEDRIFLEQLGNLQLDHELKHDLEVWRHRVARAAEVTEERQEAYEARDREAEKLWREKQDKEAQEEQEEKAEEFAQVEEERREARRRQAEEEAVRADEERQRAHAAEERRIREEQERLFREQLARKALEDERRRQEQERLFQEGLARKAREEERRRREEQERLFREAIARKAREEERRLREERERREREEREERERRLREQERRLREEVERVRRAEMERQQREEEQRKLREEVERLRREAHERFLREERERQAREEQERQAHLHAEQARLAAQEEQIRQYFLLYEAKWNELRTSNSIPPIDVREMPWPVFGIISSADQITYQDVRTFLFHPQRPGVEGKTARDKVKGEVLRFHPDKFNTRIVPKIESSQQAVAQEIAGAVARILTTMMTEEAEQQQQ